VVYRVQFESPAACFESQFWQRCLSNAEVIVAAEGANNPTRCDATLFDVECVFCLGFAEVEIGSMTGDPSGRRMPATPHGGFFLFSGTNCEQPNCFTTMICTHADQQPQRHFLPAYRTANKTRTHKAQIKGSRFNYQTSHSCCVPVKRQDCTNLTSTTAPDRCSACVPGHCRQAFDSRLLMAVGTLQASRRQMQP